MQKQKNSNKRKNPNYEPWYCFTVTKCKKCGEMFEPMCELKHICRKQNSYPVEGYTMKSEENNNAE